MPYISKDKLIKYLIHEGFMFAEYGYKYIDPIKPNHGSCCTCQDCGRVYEECVCDHNDWFTVIEELTEK